MNSTDLTKYLEEAQEALQAFLSMLLGEDITLSLKPPEEVTFAEAGVKELAHLVVLSPDDNGGSFAVLLEPTWLAVFSKAMLGEAMVVGDDGADDLLRELAGQGYGAVRTQLGDSGIKLADASFEIFQHGNMLADDALAESLWRVGVEAVRGEETLQGVAFLSATALAAPEEEAAATVEPTLAPGAPAHAAATPVGGAEAGQPVAVSRATFPELSGEGLHIDGDNFNLLAEVELEVSVELGRRKISLADVLRLTTGSVIELENLVGEPLDVYANGRLIAEGEAVVIDEQFGIRIIRLASDQQRTKAFL